MATTVVSLFRYRRPTAASRTSGAAVAPSHPARAGTILGWTPGVRALINGRVLPCGCLTGTYQLTAGGVAEILDARGPACDCPAHEVNAILEDEDQLPSGSAEQS